jgi:hypothetical protein
MANPMELPGCFKCPSDSTVNVPGVSTPFEALAGTPFTTWSWWGTSYPINWYWPAYYQGAPPGNQSPYWGDFLRILGASWYGGELVTGLGRHMLKDKGGRWSSRFIISYENRLNYALQGARPRGDGSPDEKNLQGWHKRFNHYVAGFRDGSARYLEMDTRFVNGPGWTIWPNHPWEGNWEPYDPLNP